ncbi:unnamed protein product [Allacma fusca]|uniref:Ionotropic glutamate receptor L-glutamate and glycine-binding domain-containing protein n=1 Tax=Allacma fusca TaxID=39272 RepID=A0A8J2K8J0_9HEXA|nr:unnamed protein product [Allacma fusca]
MAGIHIPPILMSNNDGVVKGGSFYEMYRLCSSQFNFTVNYHFGTKGGTGRKNPNGTWTGIMGDLLTRKVDQSAVLRLTPARYGLVDFSNFLIQDQPVFFKAHPPRSVKWDVMIRPFQGSVWLLMVLTATSLASFTFVLVTGTNSGKEKLRKNKSEDKQVLRLLRLGTSERWSYSIFLIYSLTVDQGSEIVICTRRILTLWLFCILIMGTVYKDKLYLFLTFPVEEETPTDLGGLASRPDYSVVYNYWKSSLYNTFKTSGNPIHQNLLQRFELEPNIVSCVVRAIFQSNTVCIGFESYIDFTIARNATIRSNFYPGLVTSSIMNHDPMYLGLAFQRNSIYTEAWNTIVGMVRDSGVLSKLKEQVLDTHKKTGRKWLLREWEHQPGGNVSGDLGTFNPDPPVTSLMEKLQNLIGNFEKHVFPLNTRHIGAIMSTWICLCFVSVVVFMVEIKTLMGISSSTIINNYLGHCGNKKSLQVETP